MRVQDRVCNGVVKDFRCQDGFIGDILQVSRIRLQFALEYPWF